MIRKNNKLYLSVKEYAEAAQISHQAAYKQLNTRLQNFVIMVEDKTYIDSAALDKFYGSESATEVVQVEQLQVESEINAAAAQQKAEVLQEMVDMLKKELEQKNNQINDLSLRLQEAMQTVDQEQRLHLATQQKLLLIEKQEEEAAAAAEEEAANKKGFMSKFFGK